MTTAHHEAGHAVAALALGVRVTGAHLDGDRGHVNHAYAGALESIAILMAGPLAACRHVGRSMIAPWACTSDGRDLAGAARRLDRPGGPGTRPWAWWRYDAPAPRRKIGGSGRRPDKTMGFCFGQALGFRDPGYDPDNQPAWEDEADYLFRHRLMSAEELAALERMGEPGPRAPVIPIRGR